GGCMPLALLIVFSAARGLVVSTALLLALATAAQVRSETLAEALQLAVQSNPRVQDARSRSRAADEGVPQARAGYCPSVAAHAEAGLTTDPRNPSFAPVRSTQSIGYDIMLSQPVFDSGRAASSVAVARAGAAAEQEVAHMVEHQIVFAGISAYTEVLAN